MIKTFLSPSKIHGTGIFCQEDIPAHINMGIAQVKSQDGKYKITELGKYHNHSDDPSCYNIMIGNERHLFSKRAMIPGEEITVDYRMQPDLEQPHKGWTATLNEATRIPDKSYKDVDSAILSSQYWTEENHEDDILENQDTETLSGDILQTPAAKKLNDSLEKISKEIGVKFEVNSVYPQDDSGSWVITRDHPAYPNHHLAGAKFIIRSRPSGPLLVVTLDLLTFGDGFSIEDINPGAVVSHIGSTIRHELVHMKQIQKQADNKGISIDDAFDQMLSDPRQYSMDGTKQDYLSSHIEVDAYAHEAADELLKSHSLDDALSILRDAKKGEAPSAIKQYANNMRGRKQYNDFLKKVYTYLMILSK